MEIKALSCLKNAIYFKVRFSTLWALIWGITENDTWYKILLICIQRILGRTKPTFSEPTRKTDYTRWVWKKNDKWFRGFIFSFTSRMELAFSKLQVSIATHFKKWWREADPENCSLTTKYSAWNLTKLTEKWIHLIVKGIVLSANSWNNII